MSDSDEEVVVFVDFNKTVLPPAEGTDIKVIALESENPIVQYQKQTFRGEWTESLGTTVLMRESKTPKFVDSAFSPVVPRQYEFHQLVTKVLKLNQYVLVPKSAPSVKVENEYSVESDEPEQGKSSPHR